MDRFFAALAHTPQQHFTLYFYAALLRVIEQTTLHFGSAAAAHERFPFLAGYFNEIAAAGVGDSSFAAASQQWHTALEGWEQASSIRLPDDSAAARRDSPPLRFSAGWAPYDWLIGLMSVIVRKCS